MEKTLLSAAVVALLAMAPVAMAEQSVTINGTTYTCTNSCVVTVTSTGYSVTDSDGGRGFASEFLAISSSNSIENSRHLIS